MVLEKTLESPLDSKETQPACPKGNQSLLISLNIHWKDWCWSWNSNTFAIWWEELTHLKRPWCWERLKLEGEGDDRGWDGWMASHTQWTWVWVNSGSWCWTGKSGVLQSMASQRVGHDWTTELNWTKAFIGFRILTWISIQNLAGWLDCFKIVFGAHQEAGTLTYNPESEKWIYTFLSLSVTHFLGHIPEPARCGSLRTKLRGQTSELRTYLSNQSVVEPWSNYFLLSEHRFLSSSQETGDKIWYPGWPTASLWPGVEISCLSTKIQPGELPIHRSFSTQNSAMVMGLTPQTLFFYRLLLQSLLFGLIKFCLHAENSQWKQLIHWTA